METISYSECLKEMFSLGRFGIKLELETIAGILNRLGSPQNKFFSIHIAGTNGKGSIASYIASILSCSGFKVGLYTSPHLIKFNERFCINGNMVSDEDVVESYLAVKQADTGDRKATFFEISTAMAFYLFAKDNVEWAVIETGMGGRLDATNVLQPEVTVISNLSIEHTEYLGNTIEQIAAEKGGIIKPDTPLVTGVTQGAAMDVLHQIADKKSAPVYQYGKAFSTIPESEVGKSQTSGSECTRSKLECRAAHEHVGTTFIYKGINVIWNDMATRLKGKHQIHNSALALATCELLMMKQQQLENQIQDGGQKRNRFRLTQESVRIGLAAAKWPGRLEYILKKPLVIIDGAHNLDAAENLGKYLENHYGSEKHDCSVNRHKGKTYSPWLTMIIGILDDKPYKEMLTHLLPSANCVIFTKANINRSLDPVVLKDFAVTISHAETMIIENVADAVEYAIKGAGEEESICIAGSLYVAGEAREKILKDYLKDSTFQS